MSVPLTQPELTTPPMSGLHVLARDECIALLQTVPVGRVALCVNALPVVVPVNFAVDGERLVIRTAHGTKLDAAMRNEVVAFEVDDVDPLYHSGWSVLVTGVARAVTDPEEIVRLERLPLRPWAPEQCDAFVVIPFDLVTGRRLEHVDPLLGDDD